MRRFLLSLLVTAPLAAQQQPPLPLDLSLKQAVDIALAPDGATRLRLAREATEQSRQRERQALAPLLPQIDGSYTFRSFTNNLAAFGLQLREGLPIQIPPFIGPIDTQDVRATASQSIFDLAAIRRWQAAKTQNVAAREDLNAARIQTESTVARAYLNALRAEASVAAAEANVQLAERILRRARSQKDSGTGTGMDVTRAEVQLSQENQRLILAREERRTALLNLLRSMNADLATNVRLTEPMTWQPAELPDLDQAIKASRELRPEWKAQILREKASELNRKSAVSERIPSARAFGDYGVIGASPEVMLPTRSIGISVNIPLWDGGRRDARRAEAASQARAESIRSRDVAQQIELEIRVALETLKSAEHQVLMSRQTLDLAQRELAQAERRVEAGVAPGLEVTDAQARLARAREIEVLALFRQKTARIDLAVAVGNLDMLLSR
jgi:outer membrane protein TolC